MRTEEIHGLNPLSDITRNLLEGQAIQECDIVYTVLDRNLRTTKEGLELQGLDVRLVITNNARK